MLRDSPISHCVLGPIEEEARKDDTRRIEHFGLVKFHKLLERNCEKSYDFFSVILNLKFGMEH